MPHILNALIWLFSFWMVADSIRRRTGFLWVILILWIQPWGGLVYLLILKLNEANPGNRILGHLSGASARLASGQPRGQSAGPSPGNTSTAGEPALDIADQLEAQERYREAGAIYRKALVHDQHNARALHGLARSLVELGQGEQALDTFAALMVENSKYRDYMAALEYAEALHRCQRSNDCIGLLSGLVQETERINHRLALAHYLVVDNQQERACGVLRDALKIYEGSTEAQRIEVSQWHRRIIDMLEDLSTS